MSAAIFSPFSALLAGIEEAGSSEILEERIVEAQRAGHIDANDAAVSRRLHQSLVRGRRREYLLRALLESATDLAAITDFEEVLHAIVRRTRTLLGSDMAYISLNDYETHETYIHTTDGVVTDAYRNIRMELGAGILGKIAGGTTPSQSLDYTSDPEIIHVPDIDRTVEDEGVRSILGAPLRRNGVLLGALLVADRYQRQYTGEEMWLVESLSSLASVALSNARLISEMKSAIDARDQLQAALEREHDALTQSKSLDRELTECLVGDDPYGAFLRTMREAWNVEAWIVDGGGQSLHGTADIPVSQRTLSQALNASLQSAGTYSFADPVDAAAKADGLSLQQYCLMAVSAGERLLGAVLVRGQLNTGAQRSLSRSGLIVSVMMLIDETRFESDIRTQSELITSLLDDSNSHLNTVLQRAARFGIRAGSPITVHALDAGGQEQRAFGLLRVLTDSSNGIIARHGGSIVLISSRNLAAEARLLLEERGVVATIGTDSIPSLDSSLRQPYVVAQRSLKALLALGRTGTIGDRHSLGMVGLLMHATTTEGINSLVQEALGPLLRYDAAKNADLTDTLWEYFEADRHHASTARSLHIHVNTVRQRLERVTSLLGGEWSSHRRSAQIYLALQLRRLQASPDN